MLMNLFLEKFIIETPKCFVYYDNIPIGYANEYTVRNLQLAVKNKEVDNKFEFLYNDKVSTIDNNTFQITPKFDTGFFDLSSKLSYKLIQ